MRLKGESTANTNCEAYSLLVNLSSRKTNLMDEPARLKGTGYSVSVLMSVLEKIYSARYIAHSWNLSCY